MLLEKNLDQTLQKEESEISLEQKLINRKICIFLFFLLYFPILVLIAFQAFVVGNRMERIEDKIKNIGDTLEKEKVQKEARYEKKFFLI